MAIMVRQSPPLWAVHPIYMVPSDFVLRDRFGAQVDETTFMQNVENSVLIARQWYWDTTGGYTFEAVPALYFRSAKTTAQIFTDYTGNAYYKALIGILGEVDAAGLFNRRSRHRLPEMYIPMNLEGAGNSIDSNQSYGCPFFGPGAVVGAGLLGGRTMGGLSPNFLSVPTTIATAAASNSLTLQVAAGTGRNLAVATGFKIEGSRVSSFTGSPTGATTIVCDDGSWASGATPVQPIDAVMWPYGQEPTPANAEAVQVTGVTGNTVTVVRARYSTTAITITGGGQGGGGTSIYKRQQSARIWTPPASPEAPGAEVVIVTGISGDTLTVQRGRADANLTSATTARAVLVGDNIAVTYPQSLNWTGQTVDQAIGGFVHELGHNFGMTHYNPEEVKHNPYVVEGPPGTYTVAYKDRSPANSQYREQRPSVDSVIDGSGYSEDFWEHLLHTPDNPLTPGEFGPYVMFGWWNFPFGNVAAPTAGFTANELDRVLASPFLTAQARPTDPNTVTVNTFRSAGGAIGPVGGVIVPPIGGGGGSYKVQPLGWWASDTASDTSVFPVSYNLTTPYSPVAWLQQMDANVLAVRRWYWDHLDGYTFDALASVMFIHPSKTTAQITSDPTYAGVLFLAQAMLDADAALTAIDLTDVTRLNYLVAPIASPSTDFPGAAGQTFVSSFFGAGHPTGVTGDPPCQCTSWGPRAWAGAFGAPSQRDAGATNSDVQYSRQVFAHELGHAFGYSPATHTLLPHDTSSADNLMQANLFGLGLDVSVGPLTSTQKTLMKASPFITLHPTRP